MSQHSPHEPLGHAFETPTPIRLYVENPAGRVVITAADREQTDVRLRGPHAAEVAVTRDGDRISVVAPKSRAGFFGGHQGLDIEVHVPTDSDAEVKCGSADIAATGRLGATRVKSGSGDVSFERLGGAAVIDTGSGDVSLVDVSGDLRIRSGSGDVAVERVTAAASISSGSGDIRITRAHGSLIVKTGSGDLEVVEADSDIASTTGSGDVVVRSARRGRISANGASGNVTVGVPSGTPVWTDLSTITGRVITTLPSAGEPEPGADHVELRATTVSGDIALVPA